MELLESDFKKVDKAKILLLIKTHNCFPIFMKFGENIPIFYTLFCLNFVLIGSKFWIFYQWPSFGLVYFYSTHTLSKINNGYNWIGYLISFSFINSFVQIFEIMDYFYDDGERQVEVI